MMQCVIEELEGKAPAAADKVLFGLSLCNGHVWTVAAELGAGKSIREIIAKAHEKGVFQGVEPQAASD